MNEFRINNATHVIVNSEKYVFLLYALQEKSTENLKLGIIMPGFWRFNLVKLSETDFL